MRSSEHGSASGLGRAGGYLVTLSAYYAYSAYYVSNPLRRLAFRVSLGLRIMAHSAQVARCDTQSQKAIHSNGLLEPVFRRSEVSTA